MRATITIKPSGVDVGGESYPGVDMGDESSGITPMTESFDYAKLAASILVYSTKIDPTLKKLYRLPLGGTMAAYTPADLRRFVDWGGVARITFKSTGDTIPATLVGFVESEEPYQYVFDMLYRTGGGIEVGFEAPFDATNDTICIPE